jgi:hypothetical protein
MDIPAGLILAASTIREVLGKSAQFVAGTETVRHSLLLWRANSSRRIALIAQSVLTASIALPRMASRKLA